MDNVILHNANNPGWYLKKIYYWGRSYLNLKNNDVIMAFYPKTGSTWTRIILYNLLSNNSEEDVFTIDEINKTMPSFGFENFFNSWPFENCPRLIKTHRYYYNFIYKNNRKILFARHPKDVMESYLHYANAKKTLDFNGGLSDLVKDPLMGLENYMKFYTSWLPHVDLVIKYEDMRSEPLITFKKIVSFLGLKYTDEQISIALKASSISKTRKAEQLSSNKYKSNYSKGFVFAREGKTGEGAKFFDEELDEYVKTISKKYNFKLYDLD